MSAAVQFDVDPLIAALARLDVRVQQQAQALTERAAAQTAARVLAVYPRGETGNLRAGVYWGRGTYALGGHIRYGSQGIIGAFMRSAAPHAWLYEHGSKMRRTSAGAERGRMHGRQPDARGVIRQVAPDERAALVGSLEALVAREGRL